MIRSLTTIFLLLCSILTFAQNITLKGVVTDKESQLTLSNVSILLIDGPIDFNTKSNINGEFQLPVSTQQGKTKILFKKGGYADKVTTIAIRKKDVSLGHLVIQVEMSPGEVLPDVIITAPGRPEKVYGSEQHSLADFEFVDDHLLLLTYERNPKKERELLLTNPQMEIISSIRVPANTGRTIGFEKSYDDHILLNTQHQLLQVDTDTGLQLNVIDRKEYDQNIKPIIDTLNNKVYLSNWYDKYPAFGYYEYAVVDSSYQLLREIADDFMLELCRAEYKYLSGRSKLQYYRMELELGIDKEILACIDNFDQGLYYDPIYAPMFIIEDTILIFDHCDGLLCRYSMDRTPIDSLVIDYHQPDKTINKTFCESLLLDEEEGRVYAHFQRKGGVASVKEIDLSTGEISRTHFLKYPYPENIKVKNGFVYYIYRPFESLQKKYLYREKISD